jgi:hypothetical protein
VSHTLVPDGEITLPGPSFNPIPAAVPPEFNITDFPRTYSPISFSGIDQDTRNGNGRMGDYDEETTVHGGSAPGSRFSTFRKMPGFLRRRPFSLFGSASHVGQEDWTSKRLRTLEETKEACEDKAKNQITIEELKKGFRVNVKMKPMYIFLLRDGQFCHIS